MTPRVLAIIDSIKLGGPGRGLVQVCERAEQHGFHIELANFQYASHSKSEFIQQVGSRKIELTLLRQKHRLDWAPVRQVVDLIDRHEINIVQSHGYKSHLVALAAARQCRLPWVSVNHGWTDEDLKVRVYNAVERLLVRFSDQSVVVSEKLFTEFSRLRQADKPPVLITNAVDASLIGETKQGDDIRAELGMHQSDVLLGVIGRLSNEKGQDLAVRALERLRGQLDDRIHLLFVGSGPMQQKLSNLAHTLGVQDAVHFAGHQSRILPYYAAIDALLLPSRSEGLPNVILEAFALRVPVVATDVGDVARLVNNAETGWLADTASAESIRASLAEAIANRGKWDEVAAAAEARLHPEFCPSRRTAIFADLYRSIVSQ